MRVNRKYTHFAVRKSTGKIVNGWEKGDWDETGDPYFEWLDLSDQFPEAKVKKEFKIVGKSDKCFNWDNWERN